MAADFIAHLLAAAGNLSLSELETALRRLIEIRNSKTPLFRLPGELRNSIWRMALIEDIRLQHGSFKGEAESTVQERKAASTGCPETALVFREIADRRTLGDDGFGNILQDKVFHPEPRMVALPTFFNASRQMKTEVEFIFYRDVMMGSLWNTRKHGMPILKLYKEFRSDGSKTLVDIDFGTALILGPNKCAAARRGGRIRFAEELEVESLTWAIGKPHLVTDAAPAKTFNRHEYAPRDLWILQGY